MKKKVGLLATARKKFEHPAPVIEFYTSPLFVKTLEYAKKNYDYFYFYNAPNGFLLPNQVINPKDISIKTYSAKEKREWGKKIIYALLEHESPEQTIIYLHGGKVFRKYLEPILEECGYEYVVPLEGLGIGQQLIWYEKQLYS